DAATLGGVAAEDYRTTSGTVDWTDLAGVPPGLADGADADTTYTAGAGLTLTGTAFAADRATLEGWARAVCYDTEAELTALLDDNYRAAGWVPAWTDVTGVPAGFADGTDNDTTYSAGAGLALAGTVFSVNGVTSAMIVDGAVTGADIAVGAIAGSHITTGAVGSAQLATSSVTPAHLTDGTALAEIGDDDGAGSGLDADLLDGVHLASVRSGIEYIGFGSWRSSPTRLVRTAGTITVPASGYVLVLAQGEKSADAGETWAGFIHWNGSDHNADFDYSAAAGWSLWSLQNVFPVSAGTTYVFGVSDSMGGGDGAMDVNCTSVAAVFFPVRL
ncbi:MAG: hypothetical protein JXB32_22510, partial [Deltaproteobacteria bacterium]|nr:hypothetical protein [Deltaproteobacteria bacterium]